MQPLLPPLSPRRCAEGDESPLPTTDAAWLRRFLALQVLSFPGLHLSAVCRDSSFDLNRSSRTGQAATFSHLKKKKKQKTEEKALSLLVSLTHPRLSSSLPPLFQFQFQFELLFQFQFRFSSKHCLCASVRVCVVSKVGGGGAGITARLWVGGFAVMCGRSALFGYSGIGAGGGLVLDPKKKRQVRNSAPLELLRAAACCCVLPNVFSRNEQEKKRPTAIAAGRVTYRKSHAPFSLGWTPSHASPPLHTTRTRHSHLGLAIR